MAIANKIYEQSKDLHVKNYVVYAKAADGKLYYESAYTTQVTLADAKDAFDKGILCIIDGEVVRVPVFFASNKFYTVGAGDQGAVTLGEWTVAVPSA